LEKIIMAANPYTPPRSNVADVGTGEVQEVRIFSTSGRIGRLRYLAYTTVGSFAIMFVAGMLMALLGPTVGTTVILLAYIPLVVFSIMMMIQRSHDMDWSGWMCFLSLIPFAGLIWLFKSGTQGENTYGAPPPPNTLAVKILAFAPLILIAILAAIAVPAYQDYVQRAQAAQQDSE
jgi:uncharacterized membrane protein YhaH (DUF805 family)